MNNQARVLRPVSLSDADIELIKDALGSLKGARESEMKWAAGDQDILCSDTDCIERIDALCEKLAYV